MTLNNYFFLSFLAIVLSNSMHVVEEGHVGVYFRNGALQVGFHCSRFIIFRFDQTF